MVSGSTDLLLCFGKIGLVTWVDLVCYACSVVTVRLFIGMTSAPVFPLIMWVALVLRLRLL